MNAVTTNAAPLSLNKYFGLGSYCPGQHGPEPLTRYIECVFKCRRYSRMDASVALFGACVICD